MAHRMTAKPADKSPRNPVLAVIAIFKLVKATALIVVALGAWHLLAPSEAEKFATWLTELPFVTGHALATRAAAWLLQLTPHSLEALGAGALVYAALFVLEGVGLWLGKRWAEYLTVIITASLIPFELWELARKFGSLKLAALAVNLAIVWYLIRLLRRQRHH
jgi:uncharacterized membrane protein (DUF2068 family)